LAFFGEGAGDREFSFAFNEELLQTNNFAAWNQSGRGARVRERSNRRGRTRFLWSMKFQNLPAGLSPILASREHPGRDEIVKRDVPSAIAVISLKGTGEITPFNAALNRVVVTTAKFGGFDNGDRLNGLGQIKHNQSP
jgi:hypothetical protein